MTDPHLPDTRLQALLSEIEGPDFSTEQEHRALTRDGWTLLRRTWLRRVYAHPDQQVVLKIGRAQANLNEWGFSQAARTHPLIGEVLLPLSWISPRGRAVLQPRVSRVLGRADTRERTEPGDLDRLVLAHPDRAALEALLLRCRQLAVRDLHADNIGELGGRWWLFDGDAEQVPR